MTMLKLHLNNFLPYRLSVLSNKISRNISNLYETNFQISNQEWRIMAILGEEADISAAEVANRTAMDKVAVSRAVKKLLTTGKLERHFSDSDKRRSVLSLSQTGSSIYGEIIPLVKEYEQQLLSTLSSAEQQSLDYLLKKLEYEQSIQPPLPILVID